MTGDQVYEDISIAKPQRSRAEKRTIGVSLFRYVVLNSKLIPTMENIITISSFRAPPCDKSSCHQSSGLGIGMRRDSFVFDLENMLDALCGMIYSSDQL